MKVLLTVEFYYAPGGGGIGEQARQIAEGLARLGHKVTVATSAVSCRPEIIRGVKIRGFSVSGNAVSGIKGEAESYRKFLMDNECEVMINFAANTWPTDIAFEVINSIAAKKVLSTPGLSKLGVPRYDAYFKNVYAPVLGKYDRIVYTSPNYRDKLFGDKCGLGDKAVIIPNGAGEEFLAKPIGFRKKYGIKTPYLLLNVSNHYFAKGHKFVIDAFRRMKRKDATLLVIGSRPGQRKWYSCYPLCNLKSIFFNNLQLLRGEDVPREWVVSAYRESDLFLFGSELECAPLVMYESFAAGVPFITREVGNVRDHMAVLKIVKSPDEMAKTANHILDNPKERWNLVARARQLWREKHTWEKIAAEYDKLIKNL